MLSHSTFDSFFSPKHTTFILGRPDAQASRFDLVLGLIRLSFRDPLEPFSGWAAFEQAYLTRLLVSWCPPLSLSHTTSLKVRPQTQREFGYKSVPTFVEVFICALLRGQVSVPLGFFCFSHRDRCGGVFRGAGAHPLQPPPTEPAGTSHPKTFLKQQPLFFVRRPWDGCVGI